MRRGLGVLFIAYGTLLAVRSLLDGSLPNVLQLVIALFGVALIANLGRLFLRDWTVVLAGVAAYMLGARYTQSLNMPIHYTEQIDAERVLGLGSVPTEWLQAHLYHGRTGSLEVFALVMYASHFFAVLALGFYIWIRRQGQAFRELMFGLLAASLLADILFIVYPTAPPWMASEHGLVQVHHVLKQSLLDLHLNGMAAFIGDSHRYNVVAALPSMHAAFPVVALVVALRYGLPRWVIGLQAAQLVGVWFAIVYLGDHYLVDAVAGAAVALAGVAVAHRLLARPAQRSETGPRTRSNTIPVLESAAIRVPSTGMRASVKTYSATNRLPSLE
jgi:PAP2 superfamily protein